jgi:LAO/AO transport system kinase
MNQDIKNRIKNARKRQQLSVDDYVLRIRKGDRVTLGKAITLIESTRLEHRSLAREVIEKCLPFANDSFRLGITGVPGVGKSTFIESLGLHILEKGRKLAVLAIDPTSTMTSGSILGDKTRMQFLSAAENAFIRPSPAGESLGGVARKTREVVTLCEAAGYDTIFIETVGVGQSETAVHSMTDFFLLLLLPGGGDELQGIKRGIVEMADCIAVNKADTNPILAKQAKQAYRNAVHLFPAKESKWTVKTLLCSAINKEGIEGIWQTILNYQSFVKENGYFVEKRQLQAKYWFRETIGEGLQQLFYQHPNIKKELEILEKKVEEGKMTPFAAAEILLNLFKKG